MGANFKEEAETKEDGWTDWIFPTDPKNYKIACCDCGLVHAFEFRAIAKVYDPDGKSFRMHELILEDAKDNEKVSVAFKAKRDRRATGQVRRRKKRDGERLNYE